MSAQAKDGIIAILVAVMIAFFTITAAAISDIRTQMADLQKELIQVKTNVSYIDDLCCSEMTGGDLDGSIDDRTARTNRSRHQKRIQQDLWPNE